MKVKDRASFLKFLESSIYYKYREDLWGLCLNEVKGGLILEFGTGSGTSTNAIAKLISPRKIYSFDSFDGLPEDWYGFYTKGYFKVDFNTLKFDNNVVILKGLFEDTLPIFLKEHDELIGFCHIDSDLYSSCKFVLNSLKDRLNNVIIVFDELIGHEGNEGEFDALKEFCDEYNWEVEILGYSFFQVGLKFKSINN